MNKIPFPIDHPILAVIFILIGFILIRTLFRATFKLALIASIIGFIMVVFLGYSPTEVIDKGKQMVTYTSDYVENTIKPDIYNGLKNAHVEKRPNGTVEFIGDNFEIGQTPEGKFIFHINALNLSISQDELAKYLSKDEMQKLLQTLQDKKQQHEL